MNRRRVLVTGGAGAIGDYVIADLLAHGYSPTIVGLRPPRRYDPRVGFVLCDLTHLTAAEQALRNADAVLHLAAIPHPFNTPADTTISANVTSSFNVVEAARRNGIPRIVYGCSESASGFGIHYTELRPEYLPIDEAHPCWPHETYSLSKRMADESHLPIPTLEAIGRHFDPLPPVRDPAYFAANPRASAFDTRRAKRLLGYQPAKTWETFESWEPAGPA